MHIDKWWHPYCPHMLTCLFFPTALRCTLPSPRNVHFVSRNLKNVLHWLPPEGIPEDKLIYSVKYLVYGTTRWIQDAECRNISQTWCDLSRGTSDHKELYHARVKAFLNGSCSSWTESPRFNPLTDTKIDPPAFALSSAEKSISVIVAAPKTWSRNSRNEPNYLHEIYPILQYNVSVYNTKKKTQEAVTILLGYILPVLLTVLIILVSCCCVYRYIHITKQKYPTNLVRVLYYPCSIDKCERGNLLPSEKTVINFITINITEEQKTSLEDTRLLGSAHSRDGCCDGNSVEGKASEVQLAQQDSQDACLNEEVMFENEQDEKKLPMMKLVSQRASDTCLAHNQKETFFDEKRAALEKPQTFANVVTRSATSKHQTWATQDQEAAKKAKVEDEQSIIIDWDPHTGILNIPLSNLISDEIIENVKYEDSLEEGLLSRVYERQCSAELLERDEERYLLHLKEQWGLHIQMQT
uniref:Interleukin 20 receptor subunit alpha n=1 Tax=Podarcis muralis TaxID=64176 RepID=A0A670I4N8_PODMU